MQYILNWHVNKWRSISKSYMYTLNRLSCRTFLIATSSLESHSLAWYTTPNEPLPITLVSVYETSCGRSEPCPGVATTVVTLLPSLSEKKVFKGTLNNLSTLTKLKWPYINPYCNPPSSKPSHMMNPPPLPPWEHRITSIGILQGHTGYYFKGTSRGPEALQSHLNDSYYTNVLCWQ